MPVATGAQYVEMLDRASAERHALAAVNVTSSQTLNAALRGFAEAGADGIVQITTGGAAYLAGGSGDMAAGARGLALLAHELAEGMPTLVALHTDHCPPEQLDGFVRPLLADARARRDAGAEPLFGSHMFDGSSLPLDENLAVCVELLAECAELGLLLELECGVVGGEEDAVSGEGAAREDLYTTPGDLLRVAEALGTGERGRYLLAATFGNVHGRTEAGAVELRPEVLREGQAALADAHPGARFDYVFHGSSGSSESELAEAISYGVVKVNVDSDMQFAFTEAVRAHLGERHEGKAAYDPRAWGRRAEEAMAARTAEACRQLGSAGRTLRGEG